MQRRVRALLEFLVERSPEPATVAELTVASGLRPQQTAVAVVALAEAGRIRAGFRGGRCVWSYGGADRRSSVASPLRMQYSVAEAAALTGSSEKALRRRIERGTLEVERVGRSVFVSHAALQVAGLLDGRTKKTHTVFAVRLLLDTLRQPPREAMSTWQLSSAVSLPRQAAEIVLAALAAAGAVERVEAGGAAWRSVE